MAVSATTSEAPGAASATSVVSARGARGPSPPLTAAPAKASSGISQRWCSASTIGSPAQQVEPVDVDGATDPEDGDEQRQADGGFRRGDGQHEEDDHLAALVAEHAGVGDDQ